MAAGELVAWAADAEVPAVVVALEAAEVGLVAAAAAAVALHHAHAIVCRALVLAPLGSRHQ